VEHVLIFVVFNHHWHQH